MKYNNKWALIGCVMLLAGCTDDKYDVTIDMPEITDDAALLQYLSKYDVLKSYSTDENFQLAASVSPDEFLKKELTYSMISTNLTEIDPVGVFTHAACVDAEGAISVSKFSELALEAAGDQPAENRAAVGGLSVMGPVLCSTSGVNAAYLNGLLAPIIIPYEPVEPEVGEFVLTDFESDELGKTYPMTGNSIAAVTEDPDGESGHVLHIGEEGNVANWSFPQFDVTMPEGKTLANLKTVVFDVKAPGWGGLFGGGLRMYVNGKEHAYGNCQSFGCEDNKWGRGKIKLAFNPALLSKADLESNTFKLGIGSATGSGNYYMDNIIIKWEVAGDDTGLDNLLDFEGDAIGISYPMTGNSSSKVVEDPEGVSGHVLQVGSEADPTVQSFPKFKIKLPAGHKLGDYEMFQCDMKTIYGQYGSGMRFIINGREYTGANAASSGASEGGKWARGAIRLSFVDPSDPSRYLELTDEEKALTEFEFSVGSATGKGFYYLDNFTFKRAISTEDTVIEKTPEEKDEIISTQLDSWITSVLTAGGDAVIRYSLIGEPLADADADHADPARFFWGDYLGDKYVKRVETMARTAAGEKAIQLFVTQTIDLDGNAADNVAKLDRIIKGWEADGVKIDGINILLHSVYTLDSQKQAVTNSAVDALMSALAATGKPVRISDFKVNVVDASGTAIPVTDYYNAEKKEQLGNVLSDVSDFYKRVISTYRSKLAENGIGFGFGSVKDSGSNVGIWNQNNNRTLIYEGVVNGIQNN